MLMNIMIVMVMGYLLVQTEANSSHFKVCYSNCHVVCKSHTTFPKSLLCPLTCLMTCLVPTLPITPSPSSDHTASLTNKIDHINYFCKLGCATHHCLSLSSLQNPSKFLLFKFTILVKVNILFSYMYFNRVLLYLWFCCCL